MKILTVRQPWASAIFDGKPVENRTRNIFGAYRGPLAIHAGKGYDQGATIYPVDAAGESEVLVDPAGTARALLGVIIGVVDLTNVHAGWSYACDCDDATGWPEFNAWHGVLGNPRALALPIPFTGALSLRDLDERVVRQIRHQVCLGEHETRCCAPCHHHRADMHVGCILR